MSDAPQHASYRSEALLLSLAVGIVGVTFGVLADAAGFSLGRIVVLSAVVFTGASQFAAVSVVESGGSGPAAVGSAMLIATRNVLYGPVVARFLPRRWTTRAAAAHLVIDETTAMAVAQPDETSSGRAFWFTGVMLWLFWNVGSIAGALLGSALGEPATWGIDAAFSASFVALLAPHLRRRPGQVAAFTGALLAAVALPLTPAGVPLLVAALGVVPGVMTARRVGS